MSITEQVTVDIATVEVNDRYRVELAQIAKTVDYSPDQARRLARELQDVARVAELALERDIDEDARQSSERAARAAAAQPVAVTGEAIL